MTTTTIAQRLQERRTERDTLRASIEASHNALADLMAQELRTGKSSERQQGEIRRRLDADEPRLRLLDAALEREDAIRRAAEAQATEAERARIDEQRTARIAAYRTEAGRTLAALDAAAETFARLVALHDADVDDEAALRRLSADAWRADIEPALPWVGPDRDHLTLIATGLRRDMDRLPKE